MLELFYDYCAAGKTKQALLVGQNMVNRNPGDKKIFNAYFDYLLSLARDGKGDNANVLLQQASGLIALFSENVELDNTIVDLIIKKEEELNKVAEYLYSIAQDEERERVKNEVTNNNDALSLLSRLLDKIVKCESEKDFEVYINDLGRIDQSINRDRLSSNQERKYVELTKQSSEIVSSKLAYFEKQKNRAYNIQAIEAYEKVFNMFKNGKVAGDHKEMLKALFMFDTSRLYNETLVYYNHVYNYILGQLSDDDKFTMTKYAIMCEKKR